MMERLTRLKQSNGGGRRNRSGKYTFDCAPCELAERLAAYEDAEEQGLLVRLPCKPGNDVFCIIGGGIFIGYVECWGIYENNKIVGVRVDSFGRSCTWGKTVFATREEAEKALEGMK